MRLSPSRRWLIFTASSSLFVLSQFYRAAVAVITPELTTALELNAGDLSMMSAAFFYAFAFAQLPLAVYLDRLGARRSMLILNLFGVAGALLFAMATSSGMLILARVLLGIGMAGNLMGTLKLISQLFAPAVFATLSTIVFSTGTAGSIFATTPLVLLVHTLGWRWSFVIFSLVNLMLAGIFAAATSPVSFRRQASPFAAKTASGLGEALSDIAMLFRIREYWIISAGTFCRYGVYAAIQVLFAGPYLMDVMGFSPLKAGNVLLGMNIGIICGGPFFGMLTDRWLKTRKWIIAPGLGVISLLLVIMSRIEPDTGFFWVALVFIALGVFNGSAGLMYAHIKEHVSPDKAGTAMTGINFFTMTGPAVFLQISGIFMQGFATGTTWSLPAFRSLLFIYGLCVAGVALLYLTTRDTKN